MALSIALREIEGDLRQLKLNDKSFIDAYETLNIRLQRIEQGNGGGHG